MLSSGRSYLWSRQGWNKLNTGRERYWIEGLRALAHRCSWRPIITDVRFRSLELYGRSVVEASVLFCTSWCTAQEMSARG